MTRRRHDSKSHLRLRRSRSFFGLLFFWMLLAAPTAHADVPELQAGTVFPSTVTNGKPLKMSAWFANVGNVPLAGEVIVIHTFPAGIEPVEPSIVSAYSVDYTCQVVAQQSV